MASHLVVSPHLDDGVLSRGALISAWTDNGDDVVVVTVFTGDSDGPLSNAAIADRARYPAGDPLTLRKNEDARAAAVLNFNPLHLDLPEVLHRFDASGKARIEDLDDIFGPLTKDDMPIVEQVASAVAGTIREHQPDWIHLPRGIGNHMDHAVVRAAAEKALSLGASTAEVRYYEDVPYVLTGGHQEPTDAFVQEEVWTATPTDIERWIAATAQYASQVEIMFPDSDWRREFRTWASAGRASLLWKAR